jgi:hypothetical protein
MRTVLASIYVMSATKPHTRTYTIENTVLHPTIEAGSILLTDNAADDAHAIDDTERMAIAITAATRTTGDGWHIAPTRERTTQYIDVHDDIARMTRTMSIDIPYGYTVLQRNLNGTTQYALVQCTVQPQGPRRTRVI